MSSGQRVIKGLAVGFAVFLIFIIFSAICGAGFGILKIFVGGSSSPAKSNIDHSKYSAYVDINVKYGNLIIKNSDEIKVETKNEKIKVEKDINKLYITDESSFSFNNKEDVVVYIPYDINYDIINISSGAGKLTIDGFKTKDLIMNLGAGEAKLNNIYSASTKIDTGTGSVSINNGTLNNANLDLGIGSISINADITGNSSIECGIGSVSINLPQAQDNYKFDINKGIGSISFNSNKDISDKTVIGSGNNNIKVDGGIGHISITTK